MDLMFSLSSFNQCSHSRLSISFLFTVAVEYVLAYTFNFNVPGI